jgi:hypothetical protein
MDIVNEIKSENSTDVSMKAIEREVIEKLRTKEKEALSRDKNRFKRMSFDQLMSNISQLLNKVNNSLKVKLKGKLKRNGYNIA